MKPGHRLRRLCPICGKRVPKNKDGRLTMHMVPATYLYCPGGNTAKVRPEDIWKPPVGGGGG